MQRCWKCNNPLRQDGATFCNVCGAAQKPDDPGAARAWQNRIEQSQGQSHWALSFLWLLAWPIAPLLFPFWLASAHRRLSRHVRGRLASPALASPRFQSPEGQAIAGRLAAVGGGAAGVLPAIICGVLVVGTLCVLFITPAMAPHPIRYERALEDMFEGRGAYGSYYVDSEEEYQDIWNSRLWAFDDISIYASQDSQRMFDAKAGAGVPTWSGNTDTHDRHRPFRYVEDRDGWSSTTVYRVRSVNVRWHATETGAVFLWIGVGLIYLLFGLFGVLYAGRFNRHRTAEALVAAYARGDTAFHDRLMPAVRSRNGLTTFAAIGMAVTGFLQMIAFPILWAGEWAAHPGWEKRNGIDETMEAGGTMGNG